MQLFRYLFLRNFGYTYYPRLFLINNIIYLSNYIFNKKNATVVHSNAAQRPILYYYHYHYSYANIFIYYYSDKTQRNVRIYLMKYLYI